MASLQGYTHFSHKDDKCKLGSEAECMPTTSNYGWATYEIQMSDCTTNSPTDVETTTTCVGEEETITICTSDEGCRCGSWDHDEDSLTYSDCEQMASLQGYTHFSHKDDKCKLGS